MPSSAIRLRRAPSKRERLGDDADGQRAGLLRELGDDGRRAGARAAAHAAGHEDHVGALHQALDVFGRLHRSLLADLGLPAGAEALGQLVADAQALRRIGQHQRLGVRVDRDELDAPDALLDHAVDGVGAAAAHAQHLDLGRILQEWWLLLLCFCCCHVSPLLRWCRSSATRRAIGARLALARLC